MKTLIYALILALPMVAAADATELEIEKELSLKYLEQVKAEQNTVEIEDGILMRAIYVSKTGAFPKTDSTVVVMYDGFDREGKTFDSSWGRLQPATFPLNRVISCWTKSVSLMSVGSIYKVTCPSDTAYGDRGAPSLIKGGAAISFTISLLEIK